MEYYPSLTNSRFRRSIANIGQHGLHSDNNKLCWGSPWVSEATPQKQSFRKIPQASEMRWKHKPRSTPLCVHKERIIQTTERTIIIPHSQSGTPDYFSKCNWWPQLEVATRRSAWERKTINTYSIPFPSTPCQLATRIIQIDSHSSHGSKCKRLSIPFREYWWRSIFHGFVSKQNGPKINPSSTLWRGLNPMGFDTQWNLSAKKIDSNQPSKGHSAERLFCRQLTECSTDSPGFAS